MNLLYITDKSLKDKVHSYYKNPFKYMDYIIEKYCILEIINSK